MKPYFDDGKGIQIYHGDCREVLPRLITERGAPFCDLILTDPPYNVGKDYGGHDDSQSNSDYEAFIRQVAIECLKSASNQAWVAPRYKMRLFTDIFPCAHLVAVLRGAAGPFRTRMERSI